MSHTVRLTHAALTIDGRPSPCPSRGEELLHQLYRTHVADYPKYFKMDLLGRVGFLASELLLQAETPSGLEHRPYRDTSGRAILLFGRSGSLHADTRYQATIQHPDQYYPSPSLFVYTLPNIVTGEIAIRNRYHGETDFILLPDIDRHIMRQNVESLFHDPATQSALVGWIDCPDPDHFEAEMTLVTRQETNTATLTQ